MALLSVAEAIREAKVSKATIWRAIKEGRLSVSRTNNNEVRIDPVELFRVFEPRTKPPVAASRGEAPQPDSRDSRNETELDTLRQLISSHETTIKVQDEALKDFRDRLATTERRLDQAEQERRAVSQTLTALLTHQNPTQKTSGAPKWVVVTVVAVLLVAGATVFFFAKTLLSPSETSKPSSVDATIASPDKPSSAVPEGSQTPN